MIKSFVLIAAGDKCLSSVQHKKISLSNGRLQIFTLLTYLCMDGISGTIEIPKFRLTYEITALHSSASKTILGEKLYCVNISSTVLLKELFLFKATNGSSIISETLMHFLWEKG